MVILELSDFQVHGLSPLNIEVKSECICLTGASGSGKSILLRALADLIEHKGDVSLDGKKCSETPPVQWRKWVGFLPAESAWWKDNVGEHFQKNHSEYLTQLNLPKESLTWQVSRCSTGEKQRLAIARLLQQQPKVLLLDEPTASLDPASVLIVESLIKQYAKEFNSVVIWVSHDPEQIKRIADRQLRILNNEIKELEL